MPQQYPPPEIATPCGFDRATGTQSSAGLLPGTPNPDGQITVASSDGTIQFEELPDSPEIELAEQGTIVHRFRTSWSDGFSRLQGLPRGLLQTDSYGNTYRILSSKLSSDRGTLCYLTVTSEAVSFDTPPDEFACTPVELGINIIKHPRYLYALLPNYAQSQNQTPTPPPADTPAQITSKQAVLALIQQYMDTISIPPAQNGVLSNLAIKSSVQTQVTTYAEAAAQEIVQKLWSQEDSPYVVGFQIVWAQYFWFPQFLNPGGYIEDPISTGGLPPYFGSPDGDYNISTIFDKLAELNSQCYQDFYTGGLNISWLRKADTQEYQRTWYKVTRTWIGSAIGHWDTNIYSQLPRPTTWQPNNPNPYVLLASLNNK